MKNTEEEVEQRQLSENIWFSYLEFICSLLYSCGICVDSFETDKN